MTEIRAKDTDATRAAGWRLGETLVPGDVVALTGLLGAGKTVFVQGVALALGVKEPITSPTYILISEYHGIMPIFHMDLYRLVSSDEFVWLGVDEMLNGQGVSLIEWSERASEELPDRSIHVDIRIADNNDRIVTIRYPEGEK